MVAPGMILPVGFRFMPTEQELVLFWLKRKVRGEWLPTGVVVDCDIYKEEPWNIFGTSSGQKFYVFTKLRKKGEKKRVERVAGRGTWKGQRSDPVKDGRNKVVGHNKLFVFDVKDFKSSSDKATYGHWLMHEFSLADDEGDYVLCEIRNKNAPADLEENYYFINNCEEVDQVANLLETGQLLRHDQYCNLQQFEANYHSYSSRQEISSTVISQEYYCGKRQVDELENYIYDDQAQPKRLRRSTEPDSAAGPSSINLGEQSSTVEEAKAETEPYANAAAAAAASLKLGEQQSITVEEANAGPIFKLGEQQTTVEEANAGTEWFTRDDFNETTDSGEELEKFLNETIDFGDGIEKLS